MGRFADALDSGRFLVTAEIEPPKGVNTHGFLERALPLKGLVDAINVPDQPSSIMRAAPWALCRLLLDQGIEPIMQVTGRDRNRIGIQADLLAASMIGIENILCMTGDPAGTGDHPGAKAVFDLDGTGILRAAAVLQGGKDLAGNPLHGTPVFCPGGVADPGRLPAEVEMQRLEAKVRAGARFIQTQPVFDPETFAPFAHAARSYGVPVLAGVMLLKSGGQARRLMARVPGIRVPDWLIGELDAAADPRAQAIEIAARMVRDLRGLCRGVHIMAIGGERNIPHLLTAAGLSVPSSLFPPPSNLKPLT